MGTSTNIILSIIVLHLVEGFGWLMYKLAPQKGDDNLMDDEDFLN